MSPVIRNLEFNFLFVQTIQTMPVNYYYEPATSHAHALMDAGSCVSVVMGGDGC